MCTHIAWQTVCATPSYYSYLAKAWPLRRGHANAWPPRRPAKSCGGGLAGCRCNIDDTTVCCVYYCSMLTRVLCVLFFLLQQTRAVSEKSRSRALGLGRVTAPHAHHTALPTHAQHNVPRWRRFDSLRMTGAEHRARTHGSNSNRSSSSTRIPSVVRFFSTRISHLSRCFFLFSNS